MNDEGCIALANAIIIQAVKDYHHLSFSGSWTSLFA